MKPKKKPSRILKPSVPDEVYTDREELLEYFYHIALEAIERRTMSTVLLGHRRMGKTEIFKRVVNRLFLEQKHEDSSTVVPVYYSFPDKQADEKSFALEYIENFLRYYLAFYTQNPDLVIQEASIDELFPLAKKSTSLVPSKKSLEWVIKTHKAIQKEIIPYPAKVALFLPRRVSDADDTTIAVFLDEFQNTQLPQWQFDIVAWMQEAVESNTCPHFVTGSAMSILAKEIIGRGALYGRFDGEDIEGMPEYYGAELALKAADYYKTEISKLMAPVLATRCGGNPFYITAVIRQSAKMKKKIEEEDTLNEILAVDITSGFIWGELHEQVSRWIERVNGEKITKWILYLSALEEFENPEDDPDKRKLLNLERIQEELKKREGKEVSLEKIRDVLIKLSRGDLLDYLELGNSFSRLKDPILLDFLKVWGKIEVESQNKRKVSNELRLKYNIPSQRSFNEYRGYLAEIHMSQVLLSSQRQTLPGRFFHSRKGIVMPWFTYVNHRVRLSSGKGKEIDVLGAAGPDSWICQSRWVKGKKAGIGVLKELLEQEKLVRKVIKSKRNLIWIFSHEGLTEPAKALAKKHGILWSSRKEFDALLLHLNLRPLFDPV